MSKIKNITGVIKGIKKGYTGFAEFLGKNQAEGLVRKAKVYKAGDIPRKSKVGKNKDVILVTTNAKGKTKSKTYPNVKENIYDKEGLDPQEAADKTIDAIKNRNKRVKKLSYDLGNRKIKTVGKTTLVTGYGVSEYEDSKKKALKRMKGNNNG